MLAPLWAAISPTLLVIAAVTVAVAVALVLAGLWSARRAANLPAAPKAAPKALEPKHERLPEAVPTPKEQKPAPVPPLSPPISPQEREQRRAEEDARKKEAYRQKKEAEAEERERRRQEEQEKAAQAATEAQRLKADEERRLAEAKAEEARKVQAQAGKTLADGLAKTRGGFMTRLNGLLGGGPKAIDDQLLAQLEEVLFSADIGVKTASQLLEVARSKLKRGELSDPQAVKGAIREEIERIIDAAQAGGGAGALGSGPEVWMIVGVNGAGKTTTIGKLAAQFAQRGEKVVLGAADTFRAAATEQLAIWAQRSGAELVTGPEGSDPGSVAFEAVRRGQVLGAGHVLIDTAGRLHTKAPLMEELRKVKRVLQKAEPGAPHQILLVLDSTNGQNAIAQARQFHESLQITALALTKLDGTAKGGVVIGISDELKLPVRFIGVGEQVEDLQPFEAHAFVEALFG